ncbi:MAG: hypothetical protein UX77_C0036G0008, partial [Parcubacteria group bacterium GW2011_GWA1_47_11]
MNHVRKTYIEFLYPGSFFNESSTQKVKTRDVSKVKVPKNAFGFKFFDILSVVVDVGGKKVKLASEQTNVSPMHYYGGKLYTVAELKCDLSNDLLVKNVEGEGCKKAILCRTGNWQPFRRTDV